jgi:regulator of protease activity HflC (stomatin/prohibitin superfamily)
MTGQNTPQVNANELVREALAQWQTSREGGGMINYVSKLVFLVLGVIGAAIALAISRTNLGLTLFFAIAWGLADLLATAAIQMAAEWERAVVFRFGKFHTMKGPGLFLIIPLIDAVRIVDTRIRAINIAHQSVITKDNVSVAIDGVLFFQVVSPADALIKVQNYLSTITQYAKTALRDVIGQMTLDQLMAEREQIERAIQEAVERDTNAWGLRVTGIRMEDVSLPEELMRMMSRQASAEREKRATITKAQGDKEAAVDLAAAARTMAESPGAMQLRTLQTIDGLGPTASNTVVVAVPLDIMEAIRAVGEKLGPPKKTSAE